MSWTLYDFPQVPDQVAGNGLGKKKWEKKIWFIDEHGNK
jgi:hypothetical protein